MPIYEYQCGSCGHKLEVIQSVSDPALTDCPDCKAATLRRLISPVGFRLKGSGWYETDFKERNRRNLADGGGETTGAGDSAANGSGAAAKADKGDGAGKGGETAKPATGSKKAGADGGARTASGSSADT